jgi:hypothetical protein|tara:strand:+ start:358 stop:519 length:162 start_codon:yes stop_codon:yes gene_type:complete
MKYNVVAIKSDKPTLSITSIVLEGRAQLVELTNQQAVMMAANLLNSVNLNRKE